MKDQTQRIMIVVAALQRGHATHASLAKKTKTTSRTIQRDFVALRRAGVRIRYRLVGKNWVYQLGGR